MVCFNLCQAGHQVIPSNISSGSMNNMIIVISIGSGSYHAVNAQYCNQNSDIIYWDAQNNRSGFWTKTDVKNAFISY